VGVIIGMDPHKRSATIEVVDDEHGRRLDAGRFGTDKAGYKTMLEAGRQFPDRVWAVEGCNGIGKHIAHRLVHDGETVLDVPPKLSAQVRVCSPPATAVRPTRSMRTRWRWSRCEPRAWCGSRSTTT
jgi:transposase